MPLREGLDALLFLGPLAFGFRGSFVDLICPLATGFPFAALSLLEGRPASFVELYLQTFQHIRAGRPSLGASL